ncbi:MAG: PAS domain S-box protein [Anaerolineales bacterium]|nr:PAS domain S-box protein [Anaerolineales bacterium]
MDFPQLSRPRHRRSRPANQRPSARAGRLAPLADLVRDLPEALIITDLRSNVAAWTAGAAAQYGWPAEAVLGQPLDAVLHTDYGTCAPADVRRAVHTHGFWKGEVTQQRRDGTRFPVLLALALVRDAAGQPAGLLALNHDLAELKQAEQALRISLEKYRVLFEDFPLGITITDPAGQIIESNRASERLLGLPRGEHTVRPYDSLDWQIVRPDGSPMPPTEFASVQALHEARIVADVEMGIVKGPDEVSWISMTAAPIPLEGYGVAVAYGDITERRRAEAALQASEARYRTLFGAMQEGFALHQIICDPAGQPVDYRVLEVNPAFEALSGLPRASVVGRTAREIWPALSPDWIERYGRVALTGEPCRFEQFTATPARWLEILAFSPVRGQVATILTDVTERRRAGQALAESEERLATIFRETPLVITVAALSDGRLIEVNAAFTRVVGYSRAEALGRTVLELGLLTAADQTRLLEHLAADGTVQDLVLTCYSREGRPIIGLVSGSVITMNGERCLLTMVADVTARQHSEQLLQARLRLVEFAAGHSLDELLVATLDEAEALTHSQIGFYHFLGADQRTLSLQAWSTRTTGEFCTAAGQGQHYDIDQAGVWVECIRERRPLIHNDYAALPQRRGLPPGHAAVRRELVVPVFRGAQIVAILGVGNKLTPYDDTDVRLTTQLADLAWDIAENKRAEAELRRLSQAVEQSPASIVITDLAGQIEYVNPKFTQVTGYTAAEAKGQNPRLLKSGEMPAEDYAQLWRTITAGGEWRGEFHNRRKNGELYWESASISPVFDAAGKTTHFLAIKEDITARKQEERQRAAIIAVSAALRSAANRAEMLPVILDQTRQLLDVTDAALLTTKPGTDVPVIELARGAWEGLAGQPLPAGAAATLPLIAQQQAIGALAVGSPHALDPIQLRLLEAITDIAASALQRARLHEQTQRRADEFAALYAAARELAAQPDLAWLLETIVTRALDLIPAGGARLALFDEAANELVTAFVRNLPIALGLRVAVGEGAAGWVARTWQPLIVDDYQSWDGRSPRYADTPYSALLSVPLLSGGLLIGVLQLADIGPTGRRFTPAEADTLTLLAGYAASAIHNAQVLQEARQRTDQFTLLYDAGLALNSVLEPRSQLEFLAKVTGRALQADVVEFFRVDPKTGALTLELVLGHTDAGQVRLREMAGELANERSFIHDVTRSQLPLNIPDLLAEPRYIQVDPGLRAGLWVPVQHHGQWRGILGVLRRSAEAFNARDEQLLLLFANQTAVAIQNAHLFAETERRLRRVQALRQVDVTIASSLELHTILNVLLDQALSQLGVEAAAVLLLNPPRQTLEHVASRGFRTRAIERTRLPLGEGPTGRVLRGQPLVAIPDLAQSAEPLMRADLLKGEGFAAYYAAPLTFRRQIKGVLEVFHRTPLNPDEEWLEYFETLAGQAALAVENVGLFDELQQSNAELTHAYDATIAGWSRALDLRDKETEGHSQRVTDMTLVLAGALGLSADDLTHVRRGALLHDIGKMGVPDTILLKPGPLTEAEWAVMRRHPELAYEMLSPIVFLRPALDIPYCHHERWDGAGYPRGIRGEQIPLAARIFAVVDVWDALRSDRPYRPAWERAAAREHLRQGAGSHFDPAIVKVFLELEERQALNPDETAGPPAA